MKYVKPIIQHLTENAAKKESGKKAGRMPTNSGCGMCKVFK